MRKPLRRALMPVALVSRNALKNARATLSSESQMRARLTELTAPLQDPLGADAPPTQDRVLGHILHRALMQKQKPDLAALNPSELATLYVFQKALTAAPDEAARLAQLFHGPQAVLELRDQLADVAKTRRAFEADHALYEKTQALYTTPVQGDLTAQLNALGQTDIDLWHHIILHHDNQTPAQQNAALWCLAQENCDQASVAAYFYRAVTEGFLHDAARRPCSAQLDTLARTIKAWNAGRFTSRCLALDPAAPLAEKTPDLEAALDALAEETGQRRIPNPHNLFCAYKGRAPRDRSMWDVATGRLVTRPAPSAFGLREA